MYDHWASKNYYEMFGLNKDASKKEIKEAYKNVALVYHPDSNFFDEILSDDLNKEQEKIFKLLTSAYSTLMDDKKRQEYDESIFLKVETWQAEDEDENQEEKQETKIFSFDDLEIKYHGANYGIFGSIQKVDNIEATPILSAYEIMHRQTSIVSKLMRFMGLYY